MKHKFKVVILIYTILLCICGCGEKTTVSSGEEVQEVVVQQPDINTETTTIMIYMVGSDLESAAGAATDDLAEMAASGVDTEKVNIVICTGGSAQWHSNGISAEENAFYVLHRDGLEKVSSTEEKSMGESETLSAFLTFAYDHFPADSFDLILWDHGQGPVMGYGLDKLHQNDSLTLPEIQEALRESPFGPENKLNFIGFDACLMSSAELVCVTADYADYLIASQETEPSFGWNYAFLSEVNAIQAEELPSVIVDYYLDYCKHFSEEHSMFNSEVTLSVMKLSEAERLENAVDALFAEAIDDISGGFRTLALCRVSARDLGRASTGSDYDLVDLIDLAEQMQNTYPEEATELRAAVEAVIVYNQTNAKRLNGLSLFYPYYNKNYYDYKWRDAYKTIGVFDNYLDYLNRYEAVWMGASSEAVFQTVLQPEQAGEQKYTLKLDAEQMMEYVSAGYYILERVGDDLYQPILYSSQVEEDNGLLTATFNGKTIYASDDYGNSSMIYMDELGTDGERTYLNVVTILNDQFLMLGNSQMATFQLASYPDHDEVEILAVLKDEDDDILKTGKREALDLKDWAKARLYKMPPRYLRRNENGIMRSFYDWDRTSVIQYFEPSLANGLHFIYKPIEDSGNEYYLMFDIMDASGNKYGSELMPVLPAERLQRSSETEWQEYAMNDVGEVLLFEDDDVRLDLLYSRNSASGQPFFSFILTNHGQKKYIAEIMDITVNGTVQAAGVDCVTSTGLDYLTQGLFDPIAQSTTSYLNTICQDLGVDFPDEVTFLLTMTDEDTGRYACVERPILISFPDNMDCVVRFMPYLGTTVMEQVIEENNEYRITVLGGGTELLQGVGNPVTDYDLYFKIENLSGSAMNFALGQPEVNGNRIRDSYDKYIKLDAGRNHVVKINAMDEADLGANRIDTVDTLKISVLVCDDLEESGGFQMVMGQEPAGKKKTYNIKLNKQETRMTGYVGLGGKDRQNRLPDNTVIYSEGGLKIVAHQMRVRGSDQAALVFETCNNTTQPLSLRKITGLIGDNYVSEDIYFVSVPAGEKREVKADNLMANLLFGTETEAILCEMVFVDENGKENLVTGIIRTDDASNRKIGYIWQPFCDVIAQEQVLAEENGLRITLKSLGGLPGAESWERDEFRYELVYENISDDIIMLPREQYFAVNGRTTRAYSDGGYCKYLRPGCSVSMKGRIQIQDLAIEGIYDIKVMAMTDPLQSSGWYGLVGGKLIPLNLAEKSKMTKEVKKGKLIDSVGGVDIYLQASPTDQLEKIEKGNYYWILYIENNSDEHISLQICDEIAHGVSKEKIMVGPKVMYGDVLAHASSGHDAELCVLLPDSSEEEVTEVCFRFVIRSLGGNRTITVSDNLIALKP